MEPAEIREFIELLESTWRWIILLTGLGSVGAGAASGAGQPVAPLAARLALFYAVALAVGIGLGGVDWLAHTLGGVNMGLFYTALHPLAMLGAGGGAFLAYRTFRAAGSDRTRARQATLYTLASLVIVVLALPGILVRGGVVQ